MKCHFLLYVPLLLLPFKAFSIIEVELITPITISCSGAIDIIATGSAGPFTFEWTGPGGFTSTSEDITNLCSPGVYTVKIIFPNSSCFATLSATVVQCGYISANGTVSPLCNLNSSDADINIVVLGGVGPYTYNWSNGEITKDLEWIPAGKYCLTITDKYGCTSTPECYSPSVAPPLNILLTADPSPNCLGSPGKITASIEGGKPYYLNTWSTGLEIITNISTITVASSNIYSVTVTDQCETKVASINYVISHPVMILDFKNPCDVDGIDLTVTGNTSPLSYAWKWSWDPQWSANTEDLTNIPTFGTYSVTVTDANGCTKTGSFQPSHVLNQSINGTKTNVSFGQCRDGSINLTVAGGSYPYEYIWNGPNGFSSTDSDINNLRVGQYCVTVTDLNHCSATKCFDIEASVFVSIGSITNLPYCNGSLPGVGSITLVQTGSAQLSYSWGGTNGYHSNSMNIANLNSATYTVTITNESGCSQLLSAVICCCTIENSGGAPGDIACLGEPNHPNPPITGIVLNSMIAPPTQNSSTGSLNITPVGGAGTFYYSWTGPNGFREFTQNISGLLPGIYYVTVTNGCSTNSAYFELKACSGFHVINYTHDNCTGFPGGAGLITLVLVGSNPPTTYIWSNGMTSNIINHLTAGVYSVTVSDIGGCSVVVGPITIGTQEPVISYQTNPCIKVFTCGSEQRSESGNPFSVWEGCNRAFTYCDLTGQLMPPITDVPLGTGITDIYFSASDCELYCQQSLFPTNFGTYLDNDYLGYNAQTHRCKFGSGCLFENIVISGQFYSKYVIPLGMTISHPALIKTVYDCPGGEASCRVVYKCNEEIVEEITPCHPGCITLSPPPISSILQDADSTSENICLIEYLHLLVTSSSVLSGIGIDASVDLNIPMHEYEKLVLLNPNFKVRTLSKEAIEKLYTSHFNKINNRFTVYPNPFSENLSVYIAQSFSNEELEITLCDLLGHVIFIKNVSAQNLEINTSDLSSGMYQLNIKSSHTLNSFNVVKFSNK